MSFCSSCRAWPDTCTSMEMCIRDSFNTAGGIGSKGLSALGIIGVYRLDKPDGSDGNHIIHIPAIAHVFLRDVGNQAHIVFDELSFCLLISLHIALDACALLLR